MKELIAKLESAKEGSEELDDAIYNAVGLPTEWFGAKVVGHFKMVAGGYGFNTEDGYRHCDCVVPPNYTSSIDAALTLVDRDLIIRVSANMIPGPGLAYIERAKGGGIETLGCAHAPTLPLALCIAALKARVATPD